MQGFFEIGHIAKLHGFKGEVSLFLDVSNPHEYHQLATIYLEMDGIPTPFLIGAMKPMNNGFVVLQLVGINSEADAKRVLKRAVFLPENMLPELDEGSFYDHEIMGYEVIDRFRGKIGVVQQVMDHPSNPLLQVDMDGREILIPLNAELDKKIDRELRVLCITCPEGLLDIYLS